MENNTYRIMHPGTPPDERYLDKTGEFGLWSSAWTFDSLPDAQTQNKKTGLCTHVVDEAGKLQTWS